MSIIDVFLAAATTIAAATIAATTIAALAAPFISAPTTNATATITTYLATSVRPIRPHCTEAHSGLYAYFIVSGKMTCRSFAALLP